MDISAILGHSCHMARPAPRANNTPLRYRGQSSTSPSSHVGATVVEHGGGGGVVVVLDHDDDDHRRHDKGD